MKLAGSNRFLLSRSSPMARYIWKDLFQFKPADSDIWNRPHVSGAIENVSQPIGRLLACNVRILTDLHSYADQSLLQHTPVRALAERLSTYLSHLRLNGSLHQIGGALHWTDWKSGRNGSRI